MATSTSASTSEAGHDSDLSTLSFSEDIEVGSCYPSV